MGLLEGKKLLVTGVLMDSSIAFHVARLAQEEGAEVVLTSFGRTMKITQTISRRLPEPVEVVELDQSAATVRIDATEMAGTDRMKLYVCGTPGDGQMNLIASLDNLGKGASGAAVQNLDLMIGA